MIDIVVPKGNEQEFLETAKRLGYGSVCFLYSRVDDAVASKLEGLNKAGILACIGGNSPGKKVDVVFSDISRMNVAEAVQDRKTDVIYGFESFRARDRLHQRGSGLDSVLCKMASERKKIYCVDFGRILGMKGGQKAVVLGRLKQNLALCRKYRIEVAIASFADSPMKMRNPLDLSAFLAVLGHDMGKKPLETVRQRMLFNRKRKEGKIVMEGVEFD